MAPLAASDPPSPHPTMLPRWVKRCERVCYNGITYFPLFFVYSITTWAVWVILSIGSEPTESQWTGRGTSFLGAILYGMLIWSYTAAVFTSPGTTTEQNKGYTSLPTNAPPGATSFTVKSNGELRFCKKCQARKPDRAHHCRSCNACVLKMDHHCPWLATCVGLRNYKAFMLFLVYTTLFCAVCSVASVSWLWTEIFHDSKYTESLMPVNYVMLAVISSIIGLVLAGFTGWHLLLCKRGQTTIECLEKTRYLSPLRQLSQRMQAMQPQFGFGDQSYEDLERQRERARYQEYLDEQDSEKLPNAFDLGWRRNFEHLLGPNKWLWALPISTTTGNGWSWEPSQKWLDAREAIRVERDLQRQREHAAGWGPDPNEYDDFMKNSQPPEPVVRHYLTATTSRSPPAATARRSPARGMSKADKILGRDPSLYLDEPNQESVAMQTLRRDPNYISDDDFDDFEDEFVNNPRSPPLPIGPFRNQPTRAASGFFARDAKKSDDEQRWEANDDDVD